MENVTAADETQASKVISDFKFTGEGGEYFRIWIVNTFLSIATLGIYSAWAKIRNKKYFYANTHYNESNFDYHAKPIPILKGRIIAAAVFAVYVFGPQFHPIFHAIGAIMIAAALPFFVNKGLKFNAGMSSYRNLRFHFRGTLKEAYSIYFRYLFFPIIANIVSGFLLFLQFVQSENSEAVGMYTSITLGLSAFSGLVYLFVFNRLTAAVLDYVYNNLYYGGQKVSLRADKDSIWEGITKPYMKYALRWVLIFVGLVIFGAVTGAVAINISSSLGSVLSAIGSITFVVLLYAGILYMSLRIPFLTADYVWSNLKFFGSKSKSKLEWKKFSGIAIGNMFLVAMSFGLLYPMAKIRMLKYRTESKSLESFALEELIAEDQNAPHAVTDEIADAFDFDLSIGF